MYLLVAEVESRPRDPQCETPWSVVATARYAESSMMLPVSRTSGSP
jgi:hypothetical protein